MIEVIFRFIRKVIPKPVFRFFQPIYHRFMALGSALIYNYPSKNMVVIGITGTSGKSTTVELIDAILSQAGYRVGVASTIKFKVSNSKEKLNDKKMTMIGRFQLQKILKQMLKNKCEYAIIETTSEGIRQFRHLGIYYDILVFTNLYPEHIDSHGSFENYKKAKLKLFKYLEKIPCKRLVANGNRLMVKKTIIANTDDVHAKDFLNFKVDRKIGFGLYKQNLVESFFQASNTKVTDFGLEFDICDSRVKLGIFGEHNVYNALAATAVGQVCGVKVDQSVVALGGVLGVPGRQEFIDEGQNFKVIVDYAFEPRAMGKLYYTVKNINYHKIIHVLGATGGGRDATHGVNLGKFIGERADIVIATNEDPYDDDPELIMNRVVTGARKSGKKKDKNLFTVIDRKEAIYKALDLAQQDDVVLITGKGSEQGMVIGGKVIPWDDRQVIRDYLGKK